MRKLNLVKILLNVTTKISITFIKLKVRQKERAVINYKEPNLKLSNIQ